MSEKKHRKHTKIVSEAQRGKFRSELRRRRLGMKPQMKGITTKELKSHLQEVKGKTLVARVKRLRRK